MLQESPKVAVEKPLGVHHVRSQVRSLLRTEAAGEAFFSLPLSIFTSFGFGLHHSDGGLYMAWTSVGRHHREASSRGGMGHGHWHEHHWGSSIIKEGRRALGFTVAF